MFNSFCILNCFSDNVIDSYYTTANLGKSYSLPLVKDSNGYSRILLNFNLNDFTDFAKSNTSSFTATFSMYELKDDLKYHNNNFNIELYSISSFWQEGFVYENDFSITGFSNWNNTSLGSNWSSSGGDFISSLSAFQTLTSGYEDINIDVTNIIKTGVTSGFNGIMIKYPSSLESSTSFLESINYYARHTHGIYNPKIYIQFDSPEIFDNRNSFVLGKVQTLIFPYDIDDETIFDSSLCTI